MHVSSCCFAYISSTHVTFFASILKPFCVYQRQVCVYPQGILRLSAASISMFYRASSILKAFCVYQQHPFCVRRNVIPLIDAKCRVSSRTLCIYQRPDRCDVAFACVHFSLQIQASPFHEYGSAHFAIVCCYLRIHLRDAALFFRLMADILP